MQLDIINACLPWTQLCLSLPTMCAIQVFASLNSINQLSLILPFNRGDPLWSQNA